MLIDANRMMVRFDYLNYIILSLHPDDNFLLVGIFFCETFLINGPDIEVG